MAVEVLAVVLKEAEAYDLLDALQDTQDRAYEFSGNTNKFLANPFLKIFLLIHKLKKCLNWSRRHNKGTFV